MDPVAEIEKLRGEIMTLIANVRGELSTLITNIEGETNTLNAKINGKVERMETLLRGMSAAEETRWTTFQCWLKKQDNRINGKGDEVKAIEKRLRIIEETNPGKRLDDHEKRLRTAETALTRYAAALAIIVFAVNIGSKILARALF